MTASLSAAIRTPHPAFVAAAPLARAVLAEPCAAMPAVIRGDTGGSHRFAGISRSISGGTWRDSAEFTGGDPLRG
jgi:hypothetical protein